MNDFFYHLNKIPTVLLPITQEYWEDQHKWAYDQIASKIVDDHVVDLGCGCGLLGIYLVYTGKVKTVELYDGREPQITYAQDLVNHLGLQDKIKVYKKFAGPRDIQESTIVCARFGSLTELEKFCLTNKLITLRRTKEVEPYLTRPISLPWNIEVVKRHDGFELELLTIDFIDGLKTAILGERWMEDINPLFKDMVKIMANDLNLEEVSSIGNDFLIPKV
jgi:hypothetical protein